MTPKEAYHKCNGKTNKNLEQFIINDPCYAYYYARDIIKGRWKEAESIIINNSFYAFYYALDVIKGKLPENMHNAMLLHADLYAKKYLNYIEFSSARRIKS